MPESDYLEENCATCAFLAPDDTCGNPESVYHRRPAVYRDGREVLQAGWCDRWQSRPATGPRSDA